MVIINKEIFNFPETKKKLKKQNEQKKNGKENWSERFFTF